IPRRTLTALATLQKTKGDVYIPSGSPGRKTPASDGQALAPGQGVITEGAQSSALVALGEAILNLGGDTQVGFALARSEIALFQGKLDVEADTRTPEREILFTTPH